MLVLNACTNDTLPEVQNPPHVGDADELAFIASSFVRDGADSRTAIVLPEDLNDLSQGSEFIWTAGDTIGIAPSSGAQAYFVISEGAESNRATFDGGAWALKTGEGNDYAAYYPFIGDIYLDRTQIPVNYIGQTYRPADENHNLTSLAPFDYMAAKPSQAEGASNVSFQFKHLSSLVEVQFALPKAGTVNSVYLTASEAVLPVKGTFDLTADEVAITATEEAYIIPVAVEGLTTTADNETVSVFFLMPPADLGAAELGFTVVYSYEEDGKTVRETLPFTIAKGKNMEAEKWYTYAATAMTLDGQPEAIKVDDCSVFSSDINDALGQLGGTKLRFVTGSAVTSDVLVYEYYNVQAYAVRNGDWLEVHTLAKEFVLQGSAESMFDVDINQNFVLLEELDLSDFNTSNVENMSYMFYGCSALTSITFGDDFDTSSVTNMASMFFGCSSLTSLDLSSFDTSNVTDMNNMFYNCSSLTQLDLSSFDFSSEPDCSDMLSGVGTEGTNTWIAVTQAGKEYLVSQETGFDDDYADLKVTK